MENSTNIIQRGGHFQMYWFDSEICQGLLEGNH